MDDGEIDPVPKQKMGVFVLVGVGVFVLVGAGVLVGVAVQDGGKIDPLPDNGSTPKTV